MLTVKKIKTENNKVYLGYVENDFEQTLTFRAYYNNIYHLKYKLKVMRKNVI
jgi:hypothetical protein